MLQLPASIWNEIAPTLKHPPWKQMAAMNQMAMAEAHQREADKLKTSNRVGLSYLLVAPLLRENIAISRYIEKTGQLSLRSSLPELTTITEAVDLATMEYRLDEMQQAELSQLLRQMYPTASSNSSDIDPEMI